MRKSHVVMLVCGLVVVVVVGAVAWSLKHKDDDGSTGGRGGQRAEVSVITQIATKSVLYDYVETNGEIETQSSIEVFPDIGGKIISVNVSLGSQVRRGEVIAKIDPSEPGAQYAYSPVYAPITGTITTSPKKRGSTISTSTVITTIGDVANLQISAKVPERYVAALKVGLKANIELEAYPGQIFGATVTRVSPVVDRASRTKEIILNFDSMDSRINAGMFAKVRLYTYEYAGAVVLPSDCIIERNDSRYVYITMDGSTVVERRVTVGNTVDDETQVIAGIVEGERVVIEGMRVLSNGAKIRDITSGMQNPRANAYGENRQAARADVARGAR